MPTASFEQFSKIAKINRFERLQSGLRFGELTGKQLASILIDNERGWPEDWADLAEYIVKDPHVSSVYHTRKIRVAGAKWQLQPGETTDPTRQAFAEEAARFCERALRAIPDLERTFMDLLDATGVGFSVSEIDWKPTREAVLPKDLLWRHQRRFIWGDEYQILFADRGTPGRRQGVELTPNKFVVHVPKEHSGYPPRSGSLQSVAWHWLFKRWATEWWVQSLERTGAPMLIGKYKPGTPESVRDSFLNSLKRMSSDHVGLMPDGIDIMVETAGAQVLSGEGTPHEVFSRAMDEAISKAILGATDITESGPNGARAATESRIEATLDPRMLNDGKQLWVTLERDLLRPLLEFNTHLFGGLVPPVPKGRFIHRDVEFEITPEVAQVGGASLNEIRRAAGLAPIPGRDRPLMDEAAAQQALLPPVTEEPFSDPEPAGGQDPERPLARRAPRITSLQTSTTPLAMALSGRSVDPRSLQHRQLSIPFRR